MSNKIMGNMIGSYSQMGKTLRFVDENGNEVIGVITDKEQIFNATDNDVREGIVYASDAGVSTGTKVIPSYHTHEGYAVIRPGKQFLIGGEDYDYTKLQALICAFNSNLDNSVSTEKVVINDNVYEVQSVESISVVVKNSTNSRIDLGIVNEKTTSQIVRFFYYKEIY